MKKYNKTIQRIALLAITGFLFMGIFQDIIFWTNLLNQ
jgi:hypothetical protein